jgi:transcriptional regulator with XRE-family HTH domain/CheY-like chemotaxis protein
MDYFHVLLVDDGLSFIEAAASWLEQGTDQLPAPAKVIPAGSVAEASEALKQCDRDGTPIQVAIVDLGLGPGQPSGLGVIDLLEKAKIPVAVHTDFREGAQRLMFAYAAFFWYRPVALLLKQNFSPGMSRDRTARDFARDIVSIHRRQAPHPDIASHFRPPLGRDWPFNQVLSSRSDLQKWRALVAYSSTAALVAYLGLSRSTIENWLSSKYVPVWQLLQHASRYINIDNAGIIEPDPGLPLREGEKRTYQDRQGPLHQFARSQSWFFNDPVVSSWYLAH